MAAANTVLGRVAFGRGYDVWMMAVDGTWRRNCVLNAISAVDAELTVEGSMEGLNLKEFFLLLSSTGLAYRRCELMQVKGADVVVRFLKVKSIKSKDKKSATRAGQDDSVGA